MFIFAATVLSVFDIEKVTINGVVQEPRNEFSSGVLVYVLSVLTSFTALTCRLNLQPSEAIPEHAQATLRQGGVPRPLARPS